MRRAGVLAATLLLALAFFASGCDLVDSLTPFGIGHQDYSTGSYNVNGNWAGKTGTGGDVTFQVGTDTVLLLHLRHVASGCTLSFEAETVTARIVDGGFTIELPLLQGRFVASGRFTSASSCTGTYYFEALQAGVCPTAGNGTFVAEKSF